MPALVAPAKAGVHSKGVEIRKAGLDSSLRWNDGVKKLSLFAPLALLTACAQQAASGVAPEAPGFLLGLWHGFIFPVAWLLSLFMENVAIYAVPNNGGWYDFGYFIGIVFLGVGGSHGTKRVVVYRGRRR